MRKVIMVLLLLGALTFAVCNNDHSPPSPQLILLHTNVLKIIGLSDPCKVKFVEILAVKNKTTITILSTTVNAKTVNVNAILNVKPPFTLTIRYADGTGNTGSLTWPIRYLPYITYTLEQMVVQGSKAVVMVNPPPAKPALPRYLGDVSYQTGAWLLMAMVGFALGAIKFLLSRRGS